jgi:hypothetical protein
MDLLPRPVLAIVMNYVEDCRTLLALRRVSRALLVRPRFYVPAPFSDRLPLVRTPQARYLAWIYRLVLHRLPRSAWLFTLHDPELLPVL